MVKSKHLTLIIFFLSFIKISYSQSWHTYFGDTIWDGNLTIRGIHIDGDSFIIGGAFYRIGNDTICTVAKWKNYQWTGFNLSPATDGSPNSFASYKNKLYTGSPHTWTPNGNLYNSFAIWDGVQWLPANPPIGGTIIGLKVINDSLFAVGNCEFGAKVLVTDGNTWEYLENIEANHAASIIEYNDELLVGTNYGLWKRVGYDTWQQFPGTPQGWVNAMLVDSINNFLYTGGSFFYVGDTIESHCIAKYDGFQWYPLEMGVMGDVWRGVMEMYRGDLYFGGFMNVTVIDTTWINFIGRWDGEKIHSVGGGTSGVVYGLKVFQDTLIVVGNYTYVNVLNGDSIHSQGMAKWYMPPANDCKYLRPVLHAWQQTGVSENEFYLVNGQAIVNFYNNNAYADSWQWNFGDGVSTSNERCPTHTFNYPGTYNVQLTVTDGQCIKTIEKEIKILLITNVSEELKQNTLNIYPNPASKEIWIEYLILKDKPVTKIEVFNIEGKLILTQPIRSGFGIEQIDVSNLSEGNYIIKLGEFSKKISVMK